MKFLKNCLHRDPKKRITVEKALEHPFLAKFREIDKEREIPHDVILPDIAKESIPEIRKRIDEIINTRGMKHRKEMKIQILQDLGFESGFDLDKLNFHALLKDMKGKSKKRIVDIYNFRKHDTYPKPGHKKNNFFS